MFRYLVVPIVIGLVAFSLTYFVTPLVFAESDVVAVFAKFVLKQSDSLFLTTPRLVANYLARLDLLGVSLTVALLLTIAIEFLTIFVDALLLVAKGVFFLCKRKPKPAAPKVLQEIDFEAGKAKSRPGNEFVGGGFDSLKPD